MRYLLCLLVFVTLVAAGHFVSSAAEKPHQPLSRDIYAYTVTSPSVASPEAKAYALFCKGTMAHMAGKTKEAVEFFKEALKFDPGSVVIRRALAELYAKLGDQAAYYEQVKKLAELTPDSFESHWSLALYYVATRQNKEAIAELEKALKCQVEDPIQLDVARLKLADLHRESGNYKAALALCEEILKGKPNLPVGHRTHLIAGQCYLATKDYAQAIAKFKNCISLDIPARDPATLLAYQGLTEAYIAQKKFDEALELLKATLRLTPNNYEIMRLMGVVYEKSQRIQEAIAAFKEIAASTKNHVADYFLGILYEKADKPDEAIQTYSKLIATKDEELETIRLLAHVNLSNVYARRKQFDEAISVMRKATMMVPESRWKLKPAQDLVLHLVYLMDQAGQTAEAEALLKKMLTIDPDNPQTCNYLGYMYADRGVNLEQAHELITRALKAEPENGAYLDSLGWVMFKLATVGGKPTLKEALDKLIYAAERNRKEEGAEDPVILDHIAVVAYCMGDWELAQQKWAAALKRAEEMAKDRPNALPNIEQVRKMLGWVTQHLAAEERSRLLRLPLEERQKLRIQKQKTQHPTEADKPPPR